MAKKKSKVKDVDLDELKKLTVEHKEKKYITEALLWEWKHQLVKVQLATINKERIKLRREAMVKDKEIMELKLKLYKTNTESAETMEKMAKDDYIKMKEKLEIHIGYPIEECIIDDETLEVKRVSELEANA